MCGATGAQEDIQQLQTQFYKQSMQESASVYGMDTSLYKELMSAFAPIFEKGPNQPGFSAAETNALNTEATQGVATNYQAAAKAVREQEAAQGGGNEYVPSGQNEETLAQIATEAAQQQSSEENQITEASYQQGLQEWEYAAQGMLNAGSVMSGGAQYSGAATSAGSAASTTANEIAQANNSVLGSVAGAVGAVGSKMPM